jgi:ribonuclease P protein component
MLHKDWRITRSHQYSFVYKNGRRLVGKYLIVFIVQRYGQDRRFGIVTSKKIGNAVVRNRAKRQIREVIRKNLTGLPEGYDVVVVARYTVKEATFGLIESDFLRLIRKANGK